MKKFSKKDIRKKIDDVQTKHGFANSRVMVGILGAIENGADIDDEERLFDIVRLLYRSGEHRRPSWIKHTFIKNYKFIRREFGYPPKDNPTITKKFTFDWKDRMNIKHKRGKDKKMWEELQKSGDVNRIYEI